MLNAVSYLMHQINRKRLMIRGVSHVFIELVQMLPLL